MSSSELLYEAVCAGRTTKLVCTRLSVSQKKFCCTSLHVPCIPNKPANHFFCTPWHGVPEELTKSIDQGRSLSSALPLVPSRTKTILTVDRGCIQRCEDPDMDAGIHIHGKLAKALTPS